MSDARLCELQRHLDRLRAGDESARDDLFEFAFERLELLTRKMLRRFPGVRRWEQTDDVWQNASLRLWNSLHDVELVNTRHFFNLAGLQIRRELVDLARRYSGPQGLGAHHISPPLNASAEIDSPASKHPAPATDAARLARWTEFHALVGALPEDQREVFHLIWYQGLSQGDVAELLQVSARTVKRRWQAARLALHDSMEMRDLISDG